MMFKLTLTILCWALSFACFANTLSLNVKDASLADTLRLIATAAKMNVIIDKSVTGLISVSFAEVPAMSAFNTLVDRNGLFKSLVGNIWHVSAKHQYIKFQQEKKQWHDLEIASSPLNTKLIKLRYARAADIAKLLIGEHASLFSKRGQLHVDARTNSILLQDVENNVVLLQKIIKQFDVPVKQIMIKTRLVSMDVDVERDIGVNFNVQSRAGSIARAGKYSIAIARLANGTSLDVQLSALEANGQAELISAPRLFTANQQSAFIEAGEEVPYQELSEGGGTAVAFKKAVLGLRVLPHILPNRYVDMHLKINQDRPATRLVKGVPAINTRQMVTNVRVKSGETVALGGIYEMNTEENQQAVPFLGKIPLLGVLFRTKATHRNKRELIVFVSPVIMD